MVIVVILVRGGGSGGGDELLAIIQNGKYGFINQSGKVVIPAQFDGWIASARA